MGTSLFFMFIIKMNNFCKTITYFFERNKVYVWNLIQNYKAKEQFRIRKG